jgi:hypothetical protein
MSFVLLLMAVQFYNALNQPFSWLRAAIAAETIVSAVVCGLALADPSPGGIVPRLIACMDYTLYRIGYPRKTDLSAVREIIEGNHEVAVLDLYTLKSGDAIVTMLYKPEEELDEADDLSTPSWL